MFVTSDTLDLKRIARFREFEWRENLLCGVDIHGTAWRGYEADAAFMLECAKRCGVLEEIEYAGYHRPGDKRTRPLAPKSFERLARGALAGAVTADGLLFRGVRDVIGTEARSILFGGETSGRERKLRTRYGPRPVPNYPYRAFNLDFLFPLNEAPLEKAAELLKLAVDMLGAEYGYFFVRDSTCEPSMYAHGMGTGLDHSAFARNESDEISSWGNFVREGWLWTQTPHRFRDLFQLNLLSERHTATPIKGFGYLLEWIRSQPGRGRLEDCGQGRLLWILSDAEVVEVRPAMNAAGLLFTCRDRVYRDLPQGAVDAQRLYNSQDAYRGRGVSHALRDYPGRFRT